MLDTDHNNAAAMTEEPEPEPAVVRREIQTAPPEKSIWASVQDETAFRQAAVDLALTTSECPWDADVGLSPVPGAPLLSDYVDLPISQPDLRKQKHILSEQIEHRLANDFALLAASKEAVFSVTAACIQERVDANGHLAGLKLLVAANEGVDEDLKRSLAQVWSCLSVSASEADAVHNVFAKIVAMNRLRIYQRVRKSVGHPPIFREKGRTRTNKDDKLSRAFTRMQNPKPHEKVKPTQKCRETVQRGLSLNTNLLALLENLSVEEIEQGTDDVVRQLGAIARECFNVTTDNGRVPFKHLLTECGLDALFWLKSKYVGEVDKIGAYWRIAVSMVKIHSQISRGRQEVLPPVTLDIEGVQPYVSVVNEPSIQGRPMPCYVHAEVQLITHLARQEALAELSSLSTPRIIGASKSACFLCFLFLSCYGGPKTPATHGRLYDQWTVPDLDEYTPVQVARLRETMDRMRATMVGLREDYSLKKPRDHPMTSRVDIDRLSLFDTTTESGDSETKSQNEVEAAEMELQQGTPGTGVEYDNAIRKPERESADPVKEEGKDLQNQEEQMNGLRGLLERCRVKVQQLGSAIR